MPAVHPILWPHKTDDKGHRPLWLRFNAEGRTLYLSLGVSVAPRLWNERARRVRKGHDHADAINALIERRLADAEAERLRLLSEREPVTAEALKAAAAGDTGGKADFFAFVNAFLVDVAKRGNVLRVKKERAVLAKLEEFAGSPLPFKRITLLLLQKWETWLMTEKKNKASTVQAAITVVRLHYNSAIRAGVVDASASPFPAYKPPRAERPERPKLTAAEIARLAALDLGQGGPKAKAHRKVRDWFLFSFYTAGMRFADVMQLRRSDVSAVAEGDGVPIYRVHYTMGKTKKRQSVLLVPQALEIIAPYLDRPASSFLFDALDRYRTNTPEGLNDGLRSRNAFINRRLAELAKRAEIEKQVSYHVARHSFADMARRNGWSLYDVSRALRHSTLRETDGYLASFDVEALDERMRGLFEAWE